ncbi:MAG: rRNA maturation RNase YbeY [Erysipelotrichaceae bacterium]|nr:rRNA maturation RNase YbeY [Erysipelotrichaceae bacterium]
MEKLKVKGDFVVIDFVYNDKNHLCDESYEDKYIEIIETTLNYLEIDDDVELSCVIVDDEMIHEINRDYRHIDRSTDVISFALEDNDQFYVDDMPRELGDIFISYDHALLQAKEYGHSIHREMCFLFTHGLLHLLGYDHMNEDDAQEMFALQDEILGKLKIERGVV